MGWDKTNLVLSRYTYKSERTIKNFSELSYMNVVSMTMKSIINDFVCVLQNIKND